MNPARKIDWSAALLAGVIGGAAFVVVEFVLDLALLQGAFGRQIRMTAAIVLGEDVLPSEATFDLGMILAALAVHLALSAVYGVVLAWIILRLDFGAAELVGLAFGLVLYLVNFYGFSAFFPWFEEGRHWVALVTHLAYGGITALE